jgi:hypothetical protein
LQKTKRPTYYEKIFNILKDYKMNLLKIACICMVGTAAWATNNVDQNDNDYIEITSTKTNAIKIINDTATEPTTPESTIWFGNKYVDSKLNEYFKKISDTNSHLNEYLKKIDTNLDTLENLNYFITTSQISLINVFTTIQKSDSYTTLTVGANIIYLTPETLQYPVLLLGTTYFAKHLLETDNNPIINIENGSFSPKNALIFFGLSSVFVHQDWHYFLALTACYYLTTLKADKDNKLANAGKFLSAMILVNSIYKLKKW